MSRIARRRPWRLALAAFTALAAPLATAAVPAAAARTAIGFAAVGGLPSRWESCAGDCRRPAERQLLVGPGAGAFAWVADDAGLATAMNGLEYDATIAESQAGRTVELTARTPIGGRRLVQRYEIDHVTHRLQLRLEAPPGVRLAFASGASFVPAPLPGFGAAFADVEVVRVDAAGEASVADGTVAMAAAGWLGARQRFWAVLARSPAATQVTVRQAAANQPVLEWPVASTLDLEVYGGPVERRALRAVAPELDQLLFAALWAPLRWLCFGLYFLLDAILALVGNAGLAIVLLSLAVKLILAPLTHIADGWQAEVNRTRSRLQPRLEEIRRSARGEEAHNLTLAAYREAGVHPLYTLKSLAGFSIQVPMFIAAFDMLAEYFPLAGRDFLWIDDLAAPDRLAPLPVALPFFGADFNLMPALMTALTIVSALVQRDQSLTPALQWGQRRQLYLMAAGFFLLFYTFPSGMVLYWTANNGWHLLKVLLLQARAAR